MKLYLPKIFNNKFNYIHFWGGTLTCNLKYFYSILKRNYEIKYIKI